MLNHGIYFKFGECVLRPTIWEDSEKILELWNQPFVIGKLFMAKTDLATYSNFFSLYSEDSNQYRWTIEDLEGNFIGTDSLTVSGNGKEATLGHFAMYPTDKFLTFTPGVLIRNFAFNELKVEEINFTLLSSNHKIKKYHKILKAENTGIITKKIGSNGEEICLEHWRYTRNEWNNNVETIMKLIKNFNQ